MTNWRLKGKGVKYRPAQHFVSELAKRTLLICAIAKRRSTQKRSTTAHGNGAGTAYVMLLELLARRRGGGNSEESDWRRTLSNPHSQCGFESWTATGAFPRAMVIYKYKYLYITIRE